MGGCLAYTEYQESGVEWLGRVPKHWKLLKIKRLTMVKRGASPRPIDDPKYFDDEGKYAWVRIADVTSSDRYLEKTTQRLTELGQSLSVALEPGDIFLSIAGSVGKPIITKIKCCIHDGFVYFPMLEEDREFLYYIFISGKPYLGLGKLGTQLNLNTDTVGDIFIGLPPIEEQRVIARFLDYKTAQIDALIAKKETLLKRLAEKRTALISQAVTKGLDRTVPMKDSGIKWLGKVPAHWELVQMRRRWKVIDCKHKTVEFIDEGFPIASIGEVRDHRFNLEQAKRASLEDYLDLIDGRKPEKNDLIYSRNATVGCVGFVDGNVDFCLGQDVCLIKTSAENNRFLWWQLQSISVTDQLQSIFVGATFKRINVADIKAYLICCPPVDEQQNIAQYLDEKTKVIDQQKVQIEKAIAKLKEYRTALITNAVTGKIDVRDVMLPDVDLAEVS